MNKEELQNNGNITEIIFSNPLNINVKYLKQRKRFNFAVFIAFL